MSRWLCGLILVAARACCAEMTLEQAVTQALQNYPAVKASLEQAAAAAANIGVARASYLPRADFLGQVNRATHNNVFGLLLPQPVISPISGPVLGTNSLGSVWGSAAGVLVSWEPFDFGLRMAGVEAAESARDRANAEIAVTRLEVATAAADAFLTIEAARQTALATRAGVERATVLNKVVSTLVENQLRPGAESSRTRAELALARTQAIQAEQNVAVARVALAQLLGIAPEALALDAGHLLDPPPDAPAPPGVVSRHPLALAQLAGIAEVKAREKVLDRSYFPRFNLQGTGYARGTGIQPDGTAGNAVSGLGPNIQNWGIGLSVSFPAFELFSLRAKREVEAHNELAETARYNRVLRDLNGQAAKANAMLEGARGIARNTPIQLEAARATEQQATARYKAGLGTIVEVAEAQRLLTQAEIDDALAKLGVWRALLGVAAAQGDLAPYLAQAGK